MNKTNKQNAKKVMSSKTPPQDRSRSIVLKKEVNWVYVAAFRVASHLVRSATYCSYLAANRGHSRREKCVRT